MSMLQENFTILRKITLCVDAKFPLKRIFAVQAEEIVNKPVIEVDTFVNGLLVHIAQTNMLHAFQFR